MIRLLQIIASVVAVALALYLLHWDQLVAGASHIDPSHLLAALALALMSIVAIGLRWIRIVHRLAAAPLVEHWRVYCLGTFFNSFTPANIGGDVYRVVALRRWTTGNALSILLAAVMVERVLGLWSFLFGYLISFAMLVVTDTHAFARLPSLLVYSVAPVGAGLAAMALLPYLSRVRRLMPMRFARARLAHQFLNFERGILLATTRSLGALGALSVLAWSAWVATVYVVGSSLHLDVPIALLAMIVSLTEVIRLVPVSFQGIGIREGAFSALVALAGGVPETGFVVAAVAYAAMSLALVVSGVIGGLLGLMQPRHMARVEQEVSLKFSDEC